MSQKKAVEGIGGICSIDECYNTVGLKGMHKASAFGIGTIKIFLCPEHEAQLLQRQQETDAQEEAYDREQRAFDRVRGRVITYLNTTEYDHNPYSGFFRDPLEDYEKRYLAENKCGATLSDVQELEESLTKQLYYAALAVWYAICFEYVSPQSSTVPGTLHRVTSSYGKSSRNQKRITRELITSALDAILNARELLHEESPEDEMRALRVHVLLRNE